MYTYYCLYQVRVVEPNAKQLKIRIARKTPTIMGQYAISSTGLSPSNRRPKKAKDGKYFTGTSYANGPGGFSPNPRPAITADTAGITYLLDLLNASFAKSVHIYSS